MMWKSRLIAVWFLLASAAVISAHMDPYVTFICRFVDKDGKPVSGLSVSLESQNGRNEAEISDGLAKVALGFARNYNGEIKMRVTDRKRRTVLLKAKPGGDDSVRVFPYTHSVGLAISRNADFSDFLHDGTEYPGADGKIHATPGSAKEFQVEWLPGHLSKEDAEEARIADQLDANINADLQKQLAEIRKKRAAAP